MGSLDRPDFLFVTHAGLVEVLPEFAIDQADGGKVLDTAEAKFFQLFEKGGHGPERICAADACEDARILDNRQDFSYLVSGSIYRW